jgi:hypothetical protein
MALFMAGGCRVRAFTASAAKRRKVKNAKIFSRLNSDVSQYLFALPPVELVSPCWLLTEL